MGSRFFLDNPPVSVESIKAYINRDMIGRPCPEYEHNRAHIIGSSEAMMPAVKDMVDPVNKKKINWPIVYERVSGSDHTNFLDYGIPAFTFFSGHHSDVHKPSDDPEKIDYEKMEKLSQLVYWITLELANNTNNP